MGGHPPDRPVEGWIGNETYDIVVLCVQECMYDTLFEGVIQDLGDEYFKLEVASILTVKMAVFVHKNHVVKIRNIERSYEKTGIGNIVGNKGAVAIAFQFHETSFCFIGSHLAAHQARVEERNKDYHNIVSNIGVGVTSFSPLEQFDHLIWCGDLNYRLDLPREEAASLAEQGRWEALQQHDQLLAERAKGTVFHSFREGPLEFPPTYKYAIGSRKYDIGGKKQRVPSWCDRILWSSLAGAPPLVQQRYCCYDGLTSSDHSPVLSVFEACTLLPAPPPARCAPVILTFGRLSLLFFTAAQNECGSADGEQYRLAFRAFFLDPKAQNETAATAACPPVWDASNVPPLACCVPDPAFYTTLHMLALLYRKDTIVAQGAIPMKAAMVSSEDVAAAAAVSGPVAADDSAVTAVRRAREKRASTTSAAFSVTMTDRRGVPVAQLNGAHPFTLEQKDCEEAAYR
eukprot:TRINITY_DN1062_c1_g1_i1.p1 TRINITY_DN1062_c1_g1~~TRINITY_DN1062_c1_g1_i1.p1  ORF type:complete len:458 (+),score=103.64 TRINITY_DN1062_c1_g1_i1:735-2108(+)